MAATPVSMLRIVTQGLQDKSRLNSPRGQPSVSFYRAVLRQHTRWASQWRRVEFDNLADFGRTATVTLPIIGELITRATLVVELPDLYAPQEAARNAAGFASFIGPRWSWTNAIGHSICSEAEFIINGQVIDTVDSRLVEVIDELHSPVDHWDSYNIMISRNPTNYSQDDSAGGKPTQQRLQSLEIVFPFWWNRGPGPQALPIQALSKDKVQITVSFRPVQECVYTDARVNPANPGAEATQAGPMPIMAGCGFYKTSGDPGSQPIYDMTRVGTGGFGFSLAPNGIVLPGLTMPTEWHFRDAYWIIEYVSLEDREATAFRTADLQIPIEQHVAIPVTPTNGARDVRIPLPQKGLVRDITWVAQRVEATDYNAYFLFSRDLGPPGAKGSFIPWWPNAQVPNWDYGDGYIRPAFADRKSDPLVAAKLTTRGLTRFEHEGPSMFRSLIPALGCQSTPLIDRYIYRYEFGFWSTGGLADALERPDDEIRGFSNWDLLPNKELVLTLDTDSCTGPLDISYSVVGSLNYVKTAAVIRDITSDIDVGGANRFYFTLRGGRKGATVSGAINIEQLKRAIGPTLRILLRMTTAGSTALLARKQTGPITFEYTWLAVAASGGESGGAASSAVAIGFRGDGPQTHKASTPMFPEYGGAGGGRYEDLGVGKPDGTFVQNTQAWIYADNTTGGTGAAAAGGDGYTGGGAGSLGGGGGGSYVSQYVTEVTTTKGTVDTTQIVTITLQKIAERRPPHFNIYAWLTTYNVLRITRGRGALMFSAG